MSADYNLTFSLEGTLVVRAESEEAAEREAIDCLEGFDFMGLAGSEADSCTVKVTSHYADPDDDEAGFIDVNRPAKCVEFTL
jgi:hypothetical protein